MHSVGYEFVTTAGNAIGVGAVGAVLTALRSSGRRQLSGNQRMLM